MDSVKTSESQISPNDGEIDNRILNFLLRRINVKKREYGGLFGDENTFTIVEYTFTGFPGYGFNSYQTKSYWTKIILELLEEAGIIAENWFGDVSEKNSGRQKIIKTVRKFIKNTQNNLVD